MPPVSSLPRELRGHGVEVARAGRGLERRRRLDRQLGRPHDGLRPRCLTRACGLDELDADVVRLRRAASLGLLAAREPIASAALRAAAMARRRRAGVARPLRLDADRRPLPRPAARSLRPDLVFANEREREALGDFERDWVVKRGPTACVVDGEQFPALPTDVVDPTGAGDALAAGFLVGGVELGPRRPPRAAARSSERCRDPHRGEVRDGARATGSRRRRARDDADRARLPAGRRHRGRPRSRARGARGRRGARDDRRPRRRDRRRPDGRRSSSASTPPRASSARATRGRGGSGRRRRDDGRRNAHRLQGGRNPLHGTGGLGGVHRGWPTPPDVSADLQALAQTQALVVSSGIKSLLDVPATAELLETLGVPVARLPHRRAAALLRGATAGRRSRRESSLPPEAARIAAGALGARRRRHPARRARPTRASTTSSR